MSNARNLANLLGTSATIPSGKVVTASLPTGSVLNIVSTNHSGTGTYAQNTTTTMADTGLSASITPTSNTSKVLVIIAAQLSSSNGSSVEGRTQLYRGSSLLETYERSVMGNDGGGNNLHVAAQRSFVYLDAPATTSSTTYSLKFGLASGSGTVRFNDYSSSDGPASSITLLEVAG